MSAGLEIVHSLKDELLEFGLLIVFASPLRNTTMFRVVDDVAKNMSTPGSLAILKQVQTKLHSVGNAYGDSLQDTGTAVAILDIFLNNQIANGDVRSVAKDWSAIWLAFGGFFVLLRMISKIFIVKQTRMDDFLVILAWLGAMAYEAFEALAGGKNTRECFHTWNATRDELETRMWWTYISEIIFVVVTYVIKLAVVAFFWYIVPRNSSSAFSFFHKSIFCVLVFGTVFFVGSLFTVIFQCKPVTFWRDPAGATCMPRLQVWIGLNALVFLIDIFIIILPIRVVWRLSMARREKIIVTGLFLLGTISIFIGIPRVVFVAINLSSADFTFSNCANNVLVQAEFNLAIVAVCVPATRNLVMRYMPKLLTSPCKTICSARSSLTGGRGRRNGLEAVRIERSEPKTSTKESEASLNTLSTDSELGIRV